MNRRRARSWFRLLLVFALAVIVVAPEWPAFGDAKYQFYTIVGRALRFDFFEWTADALGRKGEALLAGTHHLMTEDAQKKFVLAYLGQVAAAQEIEATIERIFTDPEVAEPLSATAQLQGERDAIRAELSRRQPLAEAIVQDQVAAVLAEEGLAAGGMTWPPVLMTMSPVPYMLIVSPRDRIAQVDSAALIPGLSTEDKELMEDAVFDRLDQSALVVPIGGLGTYPAMIRETSSINWLAEVVSHEWTHHWLSLRPVGVRYLAGPEMRTINETVASIVDLEIGPKVIARYYPELVPPPVTSAPPSTKAAPEITFDFSAEMAETRSTVDRMLGEGEIARAEAYMEARRRVFLNHGYNIRKLNQAYFAFYGGYAATPGGAAGADPVGPMLRELRAASPSLHAFLVDVGRLTSYDDLLALYARNIDGEPAIQ
ncbi:MAG: hypothetical protein KA586_03845 [Candidatus Promineofilum sp.]|nr:hypothetical protein [Promineifilum sp.]